jgi:hypothetical protein
MQLATNLALWDGGSGRNKRGWKQRKRRKGLPRNEGRRDKWEKRKGRRNTEMSAFKHTVAPPLSRFMVGSIP